MKFQKLFTTLLLLISTSLFAQTRWSFDKSHSSVNFTVTHMIIAQVEGTFKSFEGQVVANGEDFTNAQIDFSVDIASINTNNDQRDNHLKSDDFFNAEKFPKMTFKSKSFTKVGEKNWKMTGDLTIRDVTKEVTFDVKFNGIVNDPWGNERAGFKLTGSVDRFDYNLKWNKMIDATNLVVGREVDINVNVELIKSK